MAVLETGYGTSRFAKEANNLFGIRTWDKNAPQLKAKENPNASWGVKKYPTKCIVKNGTHGATGKFRLYISKNSTIATNLRTTLYSNVLNY